MSDNCLFCKIINGDIPADIVEQSDTTLAFRDINPQANTHVLIIPKVHISSTRDLNNENIDALSQMVLSLKLALGQRAITCSSQLRNNCQISAVSWVFQILEEPICVHVVVMGVVPSIITRSLL